MLSSVLNSETAIQVNIRIIRVFTKMKQLLLDNKDLYLKIEKIENKMTAHDEVIQNIFVILKKAAATNANKEKSNWISVSK